VLLLLLRLCWGMDSRHRRRRVIRLRLHVPEGDEGDGRGAGVDDSRAEVAGPSPAVRLNTGPDEEDEADEPFASTRQHTRTGSPRNRQGTTYARRSSSAPRTRDFKARLLRTSSALVVYRPDLTSSSRP